MENSQLSPVPETSDNLDFTLSHFFHNLVDKYYYALYKSVKKISGSREQSLILILSEKRDKLNSN